MGVRSGDRFDRDDCAWIKGDKRPSRLLLNDIPASTNVDLAQQVWVRENGSMTPEELVPRVSKRG
jgi:hypothetical protein